MLPTINITFNDLFPTLADWETFTQTIINYFPNTTIWAQKNPNRLTSFNVLYLYFLSIYGNRALRFSDVNVAYNRFMATFIEKYPALYVKQLTFIKNEYDQLVDAQYRDAEIIKTWSMNDVLTITRKNNEAFTNAGMIGDDTQIILDPVKDKIYQKTGTDDTDTHTTKYGKIISRDEFNLFADMQRILETNIVYGLAEFCEEFLNLFQQYY